MILSLQENKVARAYAYVCKDEQNERLRSNSAVNQRTFVHYSKGRTHDRPHNGDKRCIPPRGRDYPTTTNTHTGYLLYVCVRESAGKLSTHLANLSDAKKWRKPRLLHVARQSLRRIAPSTQRRSVNIYNSDGARKTWPAMGMFIL